MAELLDGQKADIQSALRLSIAYIDRTFATPAVVEPEGTT